MGNVSAKLVHYNKTTDRQRDWLIAANADQLGFCNVKHIQTSVFVNASVSRLEYRTINHAFA